LKIQYLPTINKNRDSLLYIRNINIVENLPRLRSTKE
jgi:hypothetical protein